MGHFITLLILGLGLAMACHSLPQSALQLNPASHALESNRTSIATIAKHSPSSGNSQTSLILKGKVMQVAPLLTGVAYQIMDETGSIWVVSSQTLAKASITLGSTLWVTGTPQYQSIPLGGKDWGEIYLQEQSRLEATPADRSTQR